MVPHSIVMQFDRMPSLYLDGPTFARHVEQMFGEIRTISARLIPVSNKAGPQAEGQRARRHPETPDKPDPDHVLTWRQRKVLQVIRESVQKRGYPPSMREIGEAVGLTSTSSVSYQLSTLQRKGYLHRDVGRPRTVEVRLPGHPAVRPEPGRQGGRRRN
jgi:hypothetical protein